MAPIIGAIIGILGAGIPELIKIYREAQDRKHELAVMDRQMKMQEQGHLQRLEEINVEADVRESEALYKSSQVKDTGVKWVDALLTVITVLVRPTVTYSYFGLYALVKVALYQMATLAGTPWESVVVSLWTETDQTMFYTVMGFWFGQRALFRNRQASK